MGRKRLNKAETVALTGLTVFYGGSVVRWRVNATWLSVALFAVQIVVMLYFATVFVRGWLADRREKTAAMAAPHESTQGGLGHRASRVDLAAGVLPGRANVPSTRRASLNIVTLCTATDSRRAASGDSEGATTSRVNPLHQPVASPSRGKGAIQSGTRRSTIRVADWKGI